MDSWQSVPGVLVPLPNTNMECEETNRKRFHLKDGQPTRAKITLGKRRIPRRTTYGIPRRKLWHFLTDGHTAAVCTKMRIQYTGRTDNMLENSKHNVKPRVSLFVLENK